MNSCPYDCLAGSGNERRMWPTGILVPTLLALIDLTACNRNNHSAAASAPLMVSRPQRAEAARSTLSREHSVTIDVPEADLDSRFQRLTNRCMADSSDHCTILESDVSSGQFASGTIKLRIDPGAVEDLIAFAANLGTLEHRSTTVEDLADSIQDTQSRLQMLMNYRKQLLELQAKAGTNIDAAIEAVGTLNRAEQSRAGQREGGFSGEAHHDGYCHHPLLRHRAEGILAADSRCYT